MVLAWDPGALVLDGDENPAVLGPALTATSSPASEYLTAFSTRFDHDLLKALPIGAHRRHELRRAGHEGDLVLGERGRHGVADELAQVHICEASR